MTKLNVFKLNTTATIPEFATEGSAAFDLRASFRMDSKIKMINPHNREMELPVKRDTSGRLSINMPPDFRVLIPTGLIFDIPDKHLLKLFIRSGMAYKNGFRLTNGTAIIDNDYVEELFLMVTNDSDTPVLIYDGDRIAQGILEKKLRYDLEEITERPGQKTDRVGGIGSTGTN